MFLSQNNRKTENAGAIAGSRTVDTPYSEWKGSDDMGWNLVTAAAGTLRLTYRGVHYAINADAIFLLAPGEPRRFSRAGYTQFCWIHFPADRMFTDQLRWEKLADGVYRFPGHGEMCAAAIDSIREICRLESDRLPFWQPLAETLIESIIQRGNFSAGEPAPDLRMEKARALIAEGVSIPDAARRCGMSRAVFYRHFMAAFHTSPAVSRETDRLRRARTLLETTKLSVSETAFAIGEKNIPYFSARFKKMFGLTPSSCRKAVFAGGKR